jgi:ABC-type transport system involved in multi-copper enzyme maturation permease subunit
MKSFEGASDMIHIARCTLKGIFRDRVFHGIIITALLFPFLPSIASLSMRQVTELSLTLSLSLISFIMLLLSVFLGGTSLWKDIERRYTYSVLGLPLARREYLLGKFCGTAIFLLLAAFVLGLAAALVVICAAGIYPPDRPVVWENLALCILFDAMKYILVIACAFFFSSVSTSFFLPIFGTIALFLAGNVTQQVYDFIHSSAGLNLSPFVRQAASGLYFILPNLSAFNLKVNAIYGIPLSGLGLFLTVCYFVVYTTILLCLSVLLFTRRELR